MSRKKDKIDRWTQQQEELISEAIQQIFFDLYAFGPMHWKSISALLRAKGYGRKIKNSIGESTSIASLALWRLLINHDIHSVNKKTIILNEFAEAEENDLHEEKVIRTFKDFGGIATLENIKNALTPEGFSDESIEKIIKDLKKQNKVKFTFMLSPKRRVYQRKAPKL